jgi:hypothetical protein
MTQPGVVLAAALSSLISAGRAEDASLRMVIRGTIAHTPPAPGCRVKVSVSVYVVEDFAGGEGHERTFYADTTTNDAGQFTAAVRIPRHWHSITASEVCIAETCWTGNAPALVRPHADDATGEQTANVEIAYE